jgi:hypothetical protein
MEPIPQIVRQRMQAAPKPEVHPDPDVLTALTEKALNERERDQVLQHLAVCADCREILAVAQPQAELQYAAVAVAASLPNPTRHGWFRGSWFRWGAAAACVVVVSGAVLLRYQSRGRLTSYSAASPVSAVSDARQAPEKRQFDQLAASSSEADKLTELKQDSARERAVLDFQAANQLAVKEQAARNLAAPGPGQKKLAAPIVGGAVSGMFGGTRAKGAAAGASGSGAAAAPPLSARVVGE